MNIDEKVSANSTVNNHSNEAAPITKPQIEIQTQPQQQDSIQATRPLPIPVAANALSSNRFSSTPNFFASNPFYGTPLIPTKTITDQSSTLNVPQNAQLKSSSYTGSNNPDLVKLGDLLCESTLDPFNDCELKTLNDIEELKKILENNSNGTINNLASTQSSLYQHTNHMKPDVKFNIEK